MACFLRLDRAARRRRSAAAPARRRVSFLVAVAMLIGFAAGSFAARFVGVAGAATGTPRAPLARGLPGHQDEEADVLATVQAFFDGLAANDPAALAATMVPEGQIVRAREVDGRVDWNLRSYAEFLEGFGGAGPQMLERMWDPQVFIRGPLAVVWTPYDFYNDGAFSHCGIDAFTLVRTEDGWKTVGVAYTVEPTGCPPSPLGPPRR